MTPLTLSPSLQRQLAIAITLAVAGAFAAIIGLPLIDAFLAREAARERLVRFDAALADAHAPGVRYDPNELAAVHGDDAEAQIALQSRFGALAQQAGLPVQAVRPLGAEALGEIGRAVWIETSLMGDLEAVADLMTLLDAERPALLLRRLEIDRGEMGRPDVFLRIRLELGRAWRIAEEAS